LQLFDKFRKLDANGYYYDAHVHEIYELQMSVYDEIAALHTSGKEKDARTLYDRSAAVFRQKLDYESVVKIQKVTPRPDPKEMPEVAKGATRRDSIMQFAVQFVGVPYKWAGNDPSGFDCSGYTKYVMKNFGYDLYRIAGDQYYKNCKKIPFSEAQKGDLIFFGPSADKVTHVGIVYSEKGEPIRMIHAGSSTGITISDVENNSYWKPLMLFAGRLVEE
jgi:cell wall-associated NlpC family hydrolase